MNIANVIEQMLVICILILVGAVLYRKKYLADSTVKQISWIIVNVTNPAILIYSAIEGGSAIPLSEIGEAFALSLASYALAALAGLLFSFILRADRQMRIAMVMMTMYANVGFIGIPLALATLGNRAMVYVSINNLIYSFLFYTTGIPLLKRSAMTGSEVQTVSSTGIRDTLMSMINAGTVSAIITLMIYIFHPSIPSLIANSLQYTGRCTTFLSMLVLGVSVASSSLRSYVSDVRTWLFVLLRSLVMPLAVILILSPFIQSDFTRSTVLLLLSVPAGNLPMIVSRELGLDDSHFSRGIILSTLLSPVTIPAVTAIAGLFFRN